MGLPGQPARAHPVSAYDLLWRSTCCSVPEDSAGAILLSGGIGITPMQSIFNGLYNDVRAGGRPNLARAHFIWSVREVICVRMCVQHA
jgi:hypothetical protein